MLLAIRNKIYRVHTKPLMMYAVQSAVELPVHMYVIALHISRAVSTYRTDSFTVTFQIAQSIKYEVENCYLREATMEDRDSKLATAANNYSSNEYNEH